MGSVSERDVARELDRSEWGPYFDALNRRLEEGLELIAAIEVTDERIDGTEAEGLPLDSITYERGDDQFAIGLGGRGSRFPAVLWHYVDRPVRVWVHEDGDVPTSVGIEAEDGRYTFVRLDPAGR
jgi:hypothetical protein